MTSGLSTQLYNLGKSEALPELYDLYVGSMKNLHVIFRRR